MAQKSCFALSLQHEGILHFVCRFQQPAREAAQPVKAAVSNSSGSAEQPAIISSLAGSSAEQLAREAVQPVKALLSITDVQWWLKTNEVVLSSSAEAMRIKEVVDCVSTKPKPKREAIAQFSKPWGVKQRIQKDRRPLPELIEELSKKVV